MYTHTHEYFYTTLHVYAYSSIARIFDIICFHCLATFIICFYILYCTLSAVCEKAINLVYCCASCHVCCCFAVVITTVAVVIFLAAKVLWERGCRVYRFIDMKDGGSGVCCSIDTRGWGIGVYPNINIFFKSGCFWSARTYHNYSSTKKLKSNTLIWLYYVKYHINQNQSKNIWMSLGVQWGDSRPTSLSQPGGS